MVAANLNATIEIVAHFAGHLHISELLARSRHMLEEGMAPHPPEFEFFMIGSGRGAAPPLEPIEIGGRKTNPDWSDGAAGKRLDQSFYFDPYRPDVRVPDLGPHRDLPPPPVGGGGSGVSSAHGGEGPFFIEGSPFVKIFYDSGGYQLFASIHQVNVLYDNDIMVQNDNPAIFDLNPVDVQATLADMVASAESLVPTYLNFSGDTATLPEFAAGVQHWLAEHGADAEHLVGPGRYVNGVLVENEDAETAEQDDDPVSDEFEQLSGQTVELGGNSATNQLLVVDYGGAAGSIIVLGNVYYTNVIIQANVLVDNDSVELAGVNPARFQANLNTTDNIATFVQDDATTYGNAALDPMMPPGTTWIVDYVPGDFYNIYYTYQSNFMMDNDIVVMTETSHFYAITAGGNTQFSGSAFYDYAQQYDLIIVAGDNHNFNMIFQYNVVLDSDVIKAISTIYGDDVTITTGGNTLENDATIVQVGGNGFTPLPEDFAALAALIGAKDGSMVYDPDLFSELPGNGTNVFSVLYIEGNYYDVNYVKQVNVIGDADTSIQIFGEVGTNPGADGADPVQHLSTGGNQATNSAVLVDFESTSPIQYVGGEAYSDSILIQTNIVTDDADEIVYNDPNTLITELAAFLGTDNEDVSSGDSGQSGNNYMQDDVVGSVMA